MGTKLKTFLEKYRAGSSGEQKFIDKHVVIKHQDRNGNGDDVFSATNIKTIKRAPENHGHDSGDDEKVYESVKIANHLIKRYGDDVRMSHVRSACGDLGGDISKVSKIVRKKLGKTVLQEDEMNESVIIKSIGTEKVAVVKDGKTVKTFNGPNAPTEARLHLSRMVKEESIDELSTAKMTKYIDKAADEHMSGKKDRVKGIDTAAHKIYKKAQHTKEEVELDESTQIDELSRDTLVNYHRKAMTDLAPLSAKKRKAETQMTNRIRSGKPLKGYTPKDKLSDAEELHYKKRNVGGMRARKRFDKLDGINTEKSDSYKTTLKNYKEEVELEEGFGSKFNSFSDFKNMASDWAGNHTHHGNPEFVSKHVSVSGGKSWHQTVSHGEDRHGNRFIIGVFNHKKGKSSEEGHGWHHHWSDGLDESMQIDELSRKTLAKYIVKAAPQITHHSAMSSFHDVAGEGEGLDWVPHHTKKLSGSAHKKKSLHHAGKAINREQGVQLAAKKLAKEEVELSEGTMRLNKVNIVHHHDHPAAKEFAKHYAAGHKGDFREGGPTDADHKASDVFHSRYSKVYDKRGFAGNGTAIYKDHKTEAHWKVDRHANGKTFYGTDHIISHHTGPIPTNESVAPIRKLTKDEIVERVLNTYVTEDFTPRSLEEKFSDAVSELSPMHQKILSHMFENLEENNREFMVSMIQDPSNHANLIDFAIKHREEF